MFNIMVRVIIIYLVVVFLMRLMGKRQIGELAPFELVIALMLADLAVIPLGEPTIPIWYGLLPLIVLSVVHLFITFMTRQSPVIRNVFNGKAVIIIDDGNIDLKELKKLNLSTEELQEELRNLGYPSITDVRYAIMETNGKISVIEKPTKMFHCIIDDGKVLKGNFDDFDQKQNRTKIVEKILKAMSVDSEKQVAFASVTNDGTVFAQSKGGTMQELKINMPKAEVAND